MSNWPSFVRASVHALTFCLERLLICKRSDNWDDTSHVSSSQCPLLVSFLVFGFMHKYGFYGNRMKQTSPFIFIFCVEMILGLHSKFCLATLSVVKTWPTVCCHFSLYDFSDTSVILQTCSMGDSLSESLKQCWYC